ncbi:hypothetical protein [Sorangium sp. So ce1099]|uniref:hypothetical protein n=1 Tax=Sorangium sp. So ce1099 TaxID=3133331 RepID=UPI003F634073
MFAERLETKLTLTIAGKAFTIQGGDVKLIELDLSSHGFSGAVEFIVLDDKAHGGGETDKLLASFVKPDLIEVSLSVKAFFADPETSRSIQPVAVAGLVTRKGLFESADPNHADRAILWRRYRIEFADPARVFWSQHFPCELYTSKSVKEVIEAHKGDKITLRYDWQAIAAASPVLYLNLQPELGASFYDLVVWYVDTRAGVFAYDYTAKAYTLSAAKDASATPVSLFGDDVGRLAVVFPETPRFSRNVLNSYTEGPATKPIANPQAAAGIRQDSLTRTPIAQRVDDRVALEKSRLVARSCELEIEFRRWPTVTLGPGVLVKFHKANLWDADAAQVPTTWRVVQHRVRAAVRDERPDAEHGCPTTTYDVEVRAELEQKDEKWVRLPSYRAPSYPGHVEGKVVSEQGEDADLTYQFYTDQETSQDQYKVKVPLWSDQIVTAPYEPHQGSGKMYLPLYKDARVLLALGFSDVSIARLVDWRAAARVAMDGQGEQIFFGKKATAATVVNHAYEDDGPVFKIARTNDKDTGTIRIKEGSLIIQVKEDP